MKQIQISTIRNGQLVTESFDYDITMTAAEFYTFNKSMVARAATSRSDISFEHPGLWMRDDRYVFPFNDGAVDYVDVNETVYVQLEGFEVELNRLKSLMLIIEKLKSDTL